MKNQTELEKELTELKAKHTEVWTLKVKDKTGAEVTVFLKELDRTTYQVASKLIQKDELQGVEALLKALWIGGDNVALITGDFKALRSASVSILPLIQTEEGELKKN